MALLSGFTCLGIGRGPSSRGGLRSAALTLLLLLLFSIGPTASAQPASPREYQVKAVFLYNFAQFVDWPPAAFPAEQTPLVIGVLGRDPFDESLDEIVRGEKVNNRTLVIQRYSRVEDIKDCHVLFISRSEAGRLDEILANLKGRGILTVGDMDDFARHGGMIQLVTEKSKVRLRINVEAAKAANLILSSKLLRPAEVVTSGKA